MITIMTLAAAVIPLMILYPSSDKTTVDTTTSTANAIGKQNIKYNTNR